MKPPMKYKSYTKNPKCNFLYYLFFYFLILGNQISNTFKKICKLNCNKKNHAVNGNISSGGTYKMITWNKGNGNFSNKRDDICITLDRFNPDIFSIHEANFSIDSDRNFKN